MAERDADAFEIGFREIRQNVDIDVMGGEQTSVLAKADAIQPLIYLSHEPIPSRQVMMRPSEISFIRAQIDVQGTPESRPEIAWMSEPEAGFLLYEGLPRQGPGSDACTREALRRLPALPAAPRVLDLGCGSGRQTLVLAATLRSRVVAVDRHRPFLARLEAAARERGLAELIETRAADMGALDLPPASVDLLWAEGAIYLLGFEDGLRLWRPLLAPGGLIAVTECSWLSPARPAAAVAFWREAYPAMGSIADNLARAERAGCAVLDSFALPASAWWDDYYTPLSRRLAAFEDDPRYAPLIVATRREIELYRRHHSAYGYVFYLMRAHA